MDILNWTIDFFKEKGLPNPRFDAEYLISSVLKINRLELYLNFDMPVEKSDREIIKRYILQRAKHVPLQYILGKTEFYGYELFVDKRVLIPRPETERLIELISNLNDIKSILEIGTGSGAISIALSKIFKNAVITATDIDKEALELARKNAMYNNCGNIRFLLSNLFENVNDKFDVIVSNPPYISPNEYVELPAEIKNYEPKKALVAQDKGLYFYKKILKDAGNYLNKEGKIFFEIGYNQADEIKNLAINSGFKNVKVIKDYNDFDRYMIIF